MSCWTKEQLENMLEDVVNELNLSGMKDLFGTDCLFKPIEPVD